MFKLRFSAPRIKHYKDGLLTVCKYDCTVFDNATKGIVTEFTVTGTSKCAINDKVNEAFGNKLADSRAKEAAYKRASQLVSEDKIYEMEETVCKFMNLIAFVDKMRYLRKKETTHIEDIIFEDEICN